jgi:O-antigen ligase
MQAESALFLAAVAAPLVWFVSRLIVDRNIGWAYAAVVYLGFFGVFSDRLFGVAISSVTTSLLVAYEFVRVVIRGTRSRFDGLDLAIGGLVLAVGVATIVNSDSVEGLIRTVIVMALVLMTGFRRLDSTLGRKIFLALAAGGLLVALSVVIQLWDPLLFGLADPVFGYANSRYSGVTSNPNAAAFFLLMGLSAMVALITTSRPSVRALWALGVAIAGWALVLTQSRSGLAAGLVLVAIWAWHSLRGGVRRFASSAVAIGVGVAAIVIFSGTTNTADSSNGTRDYSFGAGREAIWDAGLTAVSEHPWFGVPVHDASAMPNYHSDFLQLAAQFGLPAATVFAVVFMVLLHRCVIAPPFEPANGGRLLSLELLVAALIVSIGGHNVLQSGVAFWVSVAVLYRLQPKEPSRAVGGIARRSASSPPNALDNARV